MCSAYGSLYSKAPIAASFTVAKPQGADHYILIIIIFMAQLYAIVSFVGLVDFLGSKTFFLTLESIKECYEALVLAKFLALMYSYLNISISKNIVPDEVKGREIHHSFLMTLFTPHTVRLDHNTLKLLNWLSWTFTMILNVSVSLALYSLVAFFHVFTKELAPHKPLSKFLCIKGVVFFCFWQGIVLSMMVSMGIIKSHHIWLDVEHIQEDYQNTLVCVEMVLFSLIQQYAYPVASYIATKEKKNK
ncbi:hypothetical protein MKX01_003653 [Papaver californicum]|nr:hypothetical protein MKX01_003653 [Papaver californicum]